MNRLGSGELALGRSPSIEEQIERYNAITREQLSETAQSVLDISQLSFSAVGRVGTAARYQEQIAALLV